MADRSPAELQAGVRQQIDDRQTQIDRLNDWVRRNNPTGTEAADINRRIALLSSEIAALRGVHRP